MDPVQATYEAGPGGIELRHIHIVSLERVSVTEWRPRFIYSG